MNQWNCSRRAFLTSSLGALVSGRLLAQQIQQPGPARATPTVKVADPEPFRAKDGKVLGWKVTIPGNRPLATPAVVNGIAFIGGGFGSHEFYAFDAITGKQVWQYRTKDDGPTAAVVAEGFIGFNTESCELEILTMDGKPVWKKWLGDPLMSMPAVSAGRVYMAYPNSKGDRQHHLACFELKTGKEYWKKPIAGEIITAPIIKDENVYLSTLEGTVYCFGQYDGELIWKEKKNVTSAPLVWNGQCYFGRRTEVTVRKDGKEVKQQEEQVAKRSTSKQGEMKDLDATKRVADDLDYQKNAAKPLEKAQKAQDATVGFATAPTDAKLDQAMRNLGRGSVCGVWSYQGSKPFVYNGNLYSSMGDTLKCVDLKTEKVIWERNLHERKKDRQTDSLTTPPALVNGKAPRGDDQRRGPLPQRRHREGTLECASRGTDSLPAGGGQRPSLCFLQQRRLVLPGNRRQEGRWLAHVGRECRTQRDCPMRCVLAALRRLECRGQVRGGFLLGVRKIA